MIIQPFFALPKATVEEEKRSEFVSAKDEVVLNMLNNSIQSGRIV